MTPDASKHNPDPAYVRELLSRAGLSQRHAAKLLGVNDRTMRFWCSGQVDIPYTAQFALEALSRAPKAR